ncbi:hypothetical protein [Bacillus sp. UNC438CL73TsuS30]|uniref:hypothetical protein n=1 Tax=Bacillus sp. UNC438CL73TsuS30 TaxID=1340434 RepID=UPI000AE8B889|nr:hypothetical protein [Bacillus sp. UNC438CL73TsuS30]
MRIADRLSDEQKRQLEKIKSPSNKDNKRKQEKVDWNEIMGVNRDRFYRGRGGAFKSK